MATIRNQIIDAIIAKLEGAGKPSGLTVDRFPVSNVEEASVPHISVRPERETVSRPTEKQRTYPIRERRLSVALECRVKCAGSDSPDEALEALLAWITKALAPDPTLGKLALDCVEDETTWDGEEVSSRFGMATVSLIVSYTTSTADQEKNR